MTTNPNPPEQRLYPVTWDEVKEAELDDALRATPAQRLAWLEDAMRLAWAAGVRRASDNGDAQPGSKAPFNKT